MKSICQSIRTAFLLYVLIINGSLLSGQTEIPLNNPSFEDIPRQGGAGYPVPISGWSDINLFTQQSPPDIHGMGTNYWKVTTAPYDGNTFLGLCIRPNGSHEGVYQNLTVPIEQGAAYKMTMFLCQDPGFASPIGPSKTREVELVKFNHPARVRIWGSFEGEYGELLSESKPIDHSDWREYEFDLYPTQGYPSLILEVYFQNESLKSVAGHVLIDKVKLFKYE